MAELAQGGRLFGGRGRQGTPPVRGNVRPSYAVDQKHDQKLQGRAMGTQLKTLKKFANSPRDIKSKVAPYGQQLLGIAFNQRNDKEFRLEALSIVAKLGRRYAEPAEQELPQLVKDKDPDIAKAAKETLAKFQQQKKAPLGNFRFNLRR